MRRAKDRLDLVDSDLAIADVTTQFGPYTKFVFTSRRKGDQASNLVSGIALNNAHCIHCLIAWP